MARRLFLSDVPVLTEADIEELFRPPTKLQSNLPELASPLIGRYAELAELKRLLLTEGRDLVTVVGPGGMGKTHLAVQLAHQIRDTFSDGAYFINLAPVQTDEEIVPAIAKALRFTFLSGGEPKEQLLNYLRHKSMLLLLDNFEHLHTSAPLLTEIIQAAPEVKLLVTSRERLKLQTEQVYHLNGLALSEWKTVNEARQNAAVQLFLHHALRVRPNFKLQRKHLVSLREIVRLVGGMPLGLLLAAGWMEVMSPAEIAAEIGRNLDFLQATERDMPERHSSMRAIFEVSWGRLSQEEQAVFAALSVFRGGFTIEAANEVAGATPQILMKLVDHSLIVRGEDGRFDIHELLRQFGAEMLKKDGSHVTVTRKRHSAFYCAFLNKYIDSWHTRDQLMTLEAVGNEAENARQALEWATKHGEWHQLIEAIDCWCHFLNWKNQHLDGVSFCQLIVNQARSQDLKEKPLPANCLLTWARAIGWLIHFSNNFQTASSMKDEGLALLEREELTDQDTRLYQAFLSLKQAFYLVVTNPEDARLLYRQLLSKYESLGDQFGISECLFGLARIDFDTGQFEAALKGNQALIPIFEKRGDRRALANSYSMMALAKLDLGHLDEAEQLQWQSLNLFQKLDYRADISWSYANIARTLLLQGKVDEAYLIAEKGLTFIQDFGEEVANFDYSSRTYWGIKIYRGIYEEARQEIATVYPDPENIDGNPTKAWIFHLLGLLALQEDAYSEAQSAFEISTNIWHSTFPHHFIPSMTALALTNVRLGRMKHARQHLSLSLEKALAYQNIPLLMAALPGLALFKAAENKLTTALELWTHANCYPLISNSKWFQDIIARDVKGWVAGLSPETAAAAQERGWGLDLWETAEALLHELNTVQMGGG
jgi:predicted ATPase